MKVIIVTGSVGAGKSTLSKRLAKKLNYNYIDVSGLINKHRIYSGYDKKRQCKIVDVKKLNNFLIKSIEHYKNQLDNKSINKYSLNKKQLDIIEKNNKDNKNKEIKGIIIDSHLSHELPANYADLCIVAKCDLKSLEKRLRKRNYLEEKIRENLECEIFDVCLTEAKENKHKILVIDTTKAINMGELLRLIKR